MATAMKKQAIAIAIFTGALLLAGFSAASAADEAPSAEPSTYLYDAPQAPAPGLCAQWLSQKSGWTKLAEDDTTHRFQGCAVLLNDKIVAVLQKDTPTLEIYARQTPAAKRCARLQPICDGSTDLKRTSLAIKENSRSGISLEVAFASPRNERRQITYDLSAGAPFIKTTAGAGVEKLRVRAPCRFAVLPDFFGDDIVVDASTIPVPQAELPSENFLLHLVHNG